jgi:hypothetical protein
VPSGVSAAPDSATPSDRKTSIVTGAHARTSVASASGEEDATFVVRSDKDGPSFIAAIADARRVLVVRFDFSRDSVPADGM